MPCRHLHPVLLFLNLSGKFVVGRMNLLLNLLRQPPPQPFRLVMNVFNLVQTLLRVARGTLQVCIWNGTLAAVPFPFTKEIFAIRLYLETLANPLLLGSTM
jgi:hypothetical protein